MCSSGVVVIERNSLKWEKFELNIHITGKSMFNNLFYQKIVFCSLFKSILEG